MITRRTFIQRLGLGAGAAMLTPVAEGLFNEAMGQPSSRKRTIIFIGGNGISHDMLFTPPEVRAMDGKLEKGLSTRAYTWPAMLKKAEKYRDRMLLVDGLTNRQQWGHTAAYAALSGMSAANGGSNEHGGAPGGVTIDQFIAEKKSTPFKSILVSLGAPKMVFAAAAERPKAAFTDRNQLYRVLFGTKSDPVGGPLRQRLLFDRIRGDVKRLEGALAGPEKQKLDHLLSSVSTLEQRSRALEGLSCEAPPAPGSPKDNEARGEQLVSLATIALLCGMTDVIGVAVGCGPSHNVFGSYNRAAAEAGLTGPIDWAYIGHDGPDKYGPVLTSFYNFLSGVMAQTADTLAAHEEGNGSALDATTMVLMSDNADGHHSDHYRWPLAVLGGAGVIKADGRFVRYPLRGKPGSRPLVDFYATLAHAGGAPVDKFGIGGTETPTGPLADLM